MLGFLYSLLLTLLDPAVASFVLVVAAVLSTGRPTLRRCCFGLALAVVLICGNRWVVGAMLRSLEWQHLSPNPLPQADAIAVLGGGTLPRLYPRPTVEVDGGGDRVLYAAELFRRGHAPQIAVSGDVSIGGIAPRPASEDMAELLGMLGVPASAIVLERKAQNTHDHAVYLCPVFRERNIRRVLLVTSAVHMPRSLGALRHGCGAVDYIPAPTDFLATESEPVPWYRHVAGLLPTSQAFLHFSAAAHEYVGLLYYRLRGWA